MAAKRKSEENEPINVKNLIKQISKEMELDSSVIKSAVEGAILSAASKRASVFVDPRPDLDVDTGEMHIFVKKRVVVKVEDPRQEIDILSAKAKNPANMLDQMIEVEISPDEFGRIAAQSVRQGILQRLRDGVRLRVYTDYKDRVGQVMTGIVQRYERRDCIVSLGKVECLVPAQEIPMGTRYRSGDRMRALVIDVRRTPKGPQVILSRTRTELVRQLFAMEVPEISDGTVRIVEIAREPGVRTKIAVSSMNPDVDPVGACVGMKGSRVQLIVRELDNEKIDIVPYSINSENFIRSALNPAKIVSIRLNSIEKRAEVLVERESLSKAIGKRGINAKLAAKLTGWKIDVRAQEEEGALARISEIQLKYLEDFLAQIEDLPQIAREALARSKDHNSVEKLAELEPRQLMPFTNDNAELAEEIVGGAREYLDELKKMAEQDDGSAGGLGDLLRGAESLAERLRGSDLGYEVGEDALNQLAETGMYSADPTAIPDSPPLKVHDAFSEAPEESAGEGSGEEPPKE